MGATRHAPPMMMTWEVLVRLVPYPFTDQHGSKGSVWGSVAKTDWSIRRSWRALSMRLIQTAG
jgi:hypothetical protein